MQKLILTLFIAVSSVLAHLPFIQINNTSNQTFLCVIIATTPKEDISIKELPSYARILNIESNATITRFQIMLQVHETSNTHLDPFLFSTKTEKPVVCSLEEIYFINHVQKTSFQIIPKKANSTFFTVSPDDQFSIRVDEQAPTWFMKIKDLLAQKLSYFTKKNEPKKQNKKTKKASH